MFLVTAITSVITITAAAIGAMVYYRSTATTDQLAMVVAQVAAGRSGVLLEKEREQLILQNAATEAFTVTSTPKVTGTPASPGGSSGGGAPTVSAPPPNPGSAEAIAKSLLPAYGFSSDQYGCLYDLWMAESGWRYNAENASGAYGIPQALPGSKMATAGADWQTNPTTQIKWGLGYIKGSYGTPCNAWAHEQSYGWY